MKKLLLITLLILFVFTACEKEQLIEPAAQLPISSSPLNTLNTAPKVFAGGDIYVVLPDNSCMLKGSTQYPLNIQTILWNKISGPDSFFIVNPGSYETTINNLKKGIYVFSLTITDRAGLMAKDTATVSVLESGSGTNELIFRDLQWVCPMGCHMRIENFHSFVPIGTAFKAYVKRDNSLQWVEVMNISQGISKYMWTIYANGLEIL